MSTSFSPSAASTPDPSNPSELEARHGQIATALEPVLADGERWLVELDRGHVHVTAAEHDTAGRSLLRFTHPDLYGRLLALEERVQSAGGILNVPLALVLSLAGVAALDGGWFAGTFSADALAALANGWVYALWTVLVFFVVLRLRRLLSHRCYRREVAELLATCRREGVEHPQLVTLLEGDQALSHIQALLKQDLGNAMSKERRRYG